MRVKKRRNLVLSVVSLLLAGCGAISSLDEASRPLDVYELQTPAILKTGVSRDIEIVVEEPLTSGALATERIMIQPSPLQAEYLPGVRWGDTAPVMLQTLLVRSLLESRAFDSVGRQPVGSVGDYALLSELTDFQAETTADAESAVVRIRLVFRLVRESDAKVVATRAFVVTEAAAGTDAKSLVAAFSRANAKLLSGAVSWIVASTSSSA